MTTEPEIGGYVASGFEAVRDIFVENWLSQGELGAACSAVVNGETVVDLWGGWTDRAREQAWQENTLVNVYSTTKGLASAALAVLADRGELDYDAKIKEYWPEFSPFGKGELTVGQVLSHQAGICGPREKITVQDLYDWDKICKIMEEQEPFWKPGTAAGYHAIVWGHLAGEVLRRITGQSIGQYFRENLAIPLAADCYIGLPESEEYRVSTMIGPQRGTGPGRVTVTREQMKVFAAMQNSPLYQASIANPAIRPYTDVCSREWRAAEIPAANATANARGVARIYGALANGGELQGVRVISEAGIRSATKLEWGEEPDLVLMRPMPRARGFLLNPEGSYGPNAKTFGHSGAGGSVGFADPNTGLGFSYVMNQMHHNITSDPRWTRIIEAIYRKLA